MIEVYKNLWVGDDKDAEQAIVDGWNVCSVAKHGPWGHERTLGYKGKAAEGEERLRVERVNHVAFNCVDAPQGHPDTTLCVELAASYVMRHLREGKTVLVHCNQGGSRGPTVALVALAKMGVMDANRPDLLIADFLKRYPPYEPGGGMQATLRSIFANGSQKVYPSSHVSPGFANGN